MGQPLILLVDDEIEFRKVMREFLEFKGYAVLEAEEGQQALQLLDQSPRQVRVIITDLLIPVMNGIELIHRLKSKSDSDHSKIPLIICSASVSEYPALLNQVEAHFLKPLSFKLLEEALKRVDKNDPLI